LPGPSCESIGFGTTATVLPAQLECAVGGGLAGLCGLATLGKPSCGGVLDRGAGVSPAKCSRDGRTTKIKRLRHYPLSPVVALCARDDHNRRTRPRRIL